MDSMFITKQFKIIQVTGPLLIIVFTDYMFIYWDLYIEQLLKW